MDLHRPQAGGGVGGEIRVAGSRREEDHAPFLQVPHRAPSDVRLGQLLHLDGALHAGEDPELLQRVLKRQRVDHRGQHAHVVGAGAVHAFGRGGDPAEDVAAADHHAHFHA